MPIVENCAQLIQHINANAVFSLNARNQIVAKTGFSKLLQKIADFFSFRDTIAHKRSLLDAEMGRMMADYPAVENPTNEQTEQLSETTRHLRAERYSTTLANVEARLAIANSSNQELKKIALNIAEHTKNPVLATSVLKWQDSRPILTEREAFNISFEDELCSRASRATKKPLGFRENQIFSNNLNTMRFTINNEESKSDPLHKLDSLVPNKKAQAFLGTLIDGVNIFTGLTFNRKFPGVKEKLPETFPSTTNELFITKNFSKLTQYEFALHVDINKTDTQSDAFTVKLEQSLPIFLSMNSGTSRSEDAQKPMGYVNVTITHQCTLGETPEIQGTDVKYKIEA